MMEWTEEQINGIIALKGDNGESIDIFRLYGILFVGNTQEGLWDISKRFTGFVQHSVPIHLEDFEGCESEDDVHEVFNEEFRRSVMERLL